MDGLEDEPLPAELADFDCRNNRLARAGLYQDAFIERVAEARERDHVSDPITEGRPEVDPGRDQAGLGVLSCGLAIAQHHGRIREPMGMQTRHEHTRGVRRARRRGNVDRMAAILILQSFLDAQADATDGGPD